MVICIQRQRSRRKHSYQFYGLFQTTFRRYKRCDHRLSRCPACDRSFDIDLERLGNPGWNWESYQKYCKKAEGSAIFAKLRTAYTDEHFVSFRPPNPEVAAANRQICVPGAHGETGPLTTSFPEYLLAADLYFEQVGASSCFFDTCLLILLVAGIAHSGDQSSARSGEFEGARLISLN